MIYPLSKEEAVRFLPDEAKKQIWRKPILVSTKEGTYNRITLRCPLCGAFLATYKSGPGWCENGLYDVECRGCKCGQRIDYSSIPHANANSRKR